MNDARNGGEAMTSPPLFIWDTPRNSGDSPPDTIRRVIGIVSAERQYNHPTRRQRTAGREGEDVNCQSFLK